MVAERIKKIEGKQKAFCVYIPESYLRHMGWSENETIALYPNGDKLEMVSMDPAKHKKGKKDECEICGFSSFY